MAYDTGASRVLSHLSTVPAHIEGGSLLLSVLSLSGGRAAHHSRGAVLCAVAVLIVHSLRHRDQPQLECTQSLVTMPTGTGTSSTGTGVILNGKSVRQSNSLRRREGYCRLFHWLCLKRLMKRTKGLRHWGFPSALAPQYCPSPQMLDFANRTGYGMFTWVWP